MILSDYGDELCLLFMTQFQIMVFTDCKNMGFIRMRYLVLSGQFWKAQNLGLFLND